MMDKIIKIAQTNPQGFTINLETLQPVESGFAVAYSATQDSHDEKGLQVCIEHAAQHGQTIGGWLDEETGKYYYDSVRIIQDEETAIEFGRSQEQIAIYQIETGRLIKL